MKQRKGFTLIELMIVIAIIIILAAIAIPNYLRMTDRARRSRVAGDFTSIATALGAYQIDWGMYPKIVSPGEEFGKGKPDAVITGELSGGAKATANVPSATTLTGEVGPIEYMSATSINAMYDPFIPANGYWYGSKDGSNWVLYTIEKTGTYLYRTNAITDLTEVTSTPSIP